jgi:hypothetical protein
MRAHGWPRETVATALCAIAVALAACGGDSKPAGNAATDAQTVRVSCDQSFATTIPMRDAIVDGEYVDIGPLTLVRFRQLAAQRPIAARSLKVLVIATPGEAITVTIDARDRSRAGFLPGPAANVNPLPADAKPRFQIEGCTEGRRSRRSLGYVMTWAVASPGCVRFRVAEADETTRAAFPFGTQRSCRS